MKFEKLFESHKELLPLRKDLENAYEILVKCFENQGKLMVCGNGGSSCDAQHIAGELMKSFVIKRPLSSAEKEALAKSGDDGSLANSLEKGLPVIVLSALEGLISAYSNDVEYSLAYAQQLYCYAQENDVLLAISCSGNSENIIKAVIAAKAKGIKTIALTGRNGGKLAKIVDCSIIVPLEDIYRIQEMHLPIYHSLCMALEERFFGDKYDRL